MTTTEQTGGSHRWWRRAMDWLRGTQQIPRVSVSDLAVASHKNDSNLFLELKSQYVRSTGSLLELFLSADTCAGIALVAEPRFRLRRARYRIDVAYAYSSGVVEFDDAFREIRSDEREASVVLRGKPQNLITQFAYSSLEFMLVTLDDTRAQDSNERRQRLVETACSIKKDLVRLESMTKTSARQGALLHYLAGFPIGAAIGALLPYLVLNSELLAAFFGQSLLPVCLGAGAIGAIISVMSRLRVNGGLDVDHSQGRFVTVLSGAFRPVVGAVFGAALYVLVLGGILPVATPPQFGEGEGSLNAEAVMFFAGLSFIAGFSERWAQDTIVNSRSAIFAEAPGRRPGA